MHKESILEDYQIILLAPLMLYVGNLDNHNELTIPWFESAGTMFMAWLFKLLKN